MPEPTTRRPVPITHGIAPTASSGGPGAPPGLSLTEPGDVVAAVPYLLGHEPADSLVAIGLRSGRRVGVVARVDVTADLLAVDPAPDVAQRLVAALLTDGDEAVILVSYDATDPPAPLGPPAAAVLAALEPCLTQADIDTFDVLRVGPRRWRSVLCEEPACCPAAGSDMAATRTSPVAVDFVLAGRSPAAHRDALEPASPTPSPAARRAATTAASRWRRGGGAGHELVGRQYLLRDWVALVDQYRRDGRLPTPGRSGRLAAGWSDDLRLRDACMVAVLPGAHLLPDALVAGVAADLRPVLADRACAGAVVAVAPVLRAMAGCLAGPELAGVLAVHAWLSWASGSGGAAGDLATRALATHPELRLAQLVQSMLDRAVPPDWAAPGVSEVTPQRWSPGAAGG